jgi:hypothetical protein
MANKYMKKGLAYLAMKEMQIKTSLRFHLTPIRMVFFKKTNGNKCWQGCGGKGHLHSWWEYKLVQCYGNQSGGSRNGGRNKKQ